MTTPKNHPLQRVEIQIDGMDCAHCSKNVQTAIAALPGVQHAEVYLGAEKAVVHFDSSQASVTGIQDAVRATGYSVRSDTDTLPEANDKKIHHLSILYFALIGILVVLIVIFGEWFGWLEVLSATVPTWVGFALVLAGGWPIWRNIIHSARQKQITAQMLMALGVVGALAIGQWATAAVIVVFMRIGDSIESWTTDRSRTALRDLTALAPQQAYVLTESGELMKPIDEVRSGDIVRVRAGEKIPVDGTIITGQADIDQASITGEPLPIDAAEGDTVYAASMVLAGSIDVRTLQVGAETTFGKVVKLVEEAESNQSDIQRFADRFTGYFLPIVLTAAILTLVLRDDPLAAVAVLVVACSCAIALATPIAVMASVGAAAKHGLLIKGGKYLETLDHCDVLFLDKTGTLTLGQPEILEVIQINGLSKTELLSLAASVEALSEHPYAHSVLQSAKTFNAEFKPVKDFRAYPGRGIEGTVDGVHVRVGNRRFIDGGEAVSDRFAHSNNQGTILIIETNGELAGALIAKDQLRSEVPSAIEQLRQLGIQDIHLLTGDTPSAAEELADELGIVYHADLLPEDKIEIVRAFQLGGHKVVMIGDGINDAPALAQADVGIAMGAVGSDIAIESADIALMREDWSAIPDVFSIAKRTMRVVRMNLVFTGVFNMLGIALAAFGVIPPVIAAAAQSIPDLAILANSSRLLNQ